MKVQERPHGDLTAYFLWCPACDELHMIDSKWQFDGNMENPTFSPSILTWQGNDPNGPDYNPNDARPFKRCHSFLRAGVWQYLGDCTHEHAGKNLEAVELPDWLTREN